MDQTFKGSLTEGWWVGKMQFLDAQNNLLAVLVLDRWRDNDAVLYLPNPVFPGQTPVQVTNQGKDTITDVGINMYPFANIVSRNRMHNRDNYVQLVRPYTSRLPDKKKDWHTLYCTRWAGPTRFNYNDLVHDYDADTMKFKEMDKNKGVCICANESRPDLNLPFASYIAAGADPLLMLAVQMACKQFRLQAHKMTNAGLGGAMMNAAFS